MAVSRISRGFELFTANGDEPDFDAPVERGGMTIYELRLDPQDVGKIIGRQGVTINAIRSLLQAGSAKQGLRCSVEIVVDGKKS